MVAHEMAHVNRCDYMTQLAAQIACAVFWFHPLVWLAAIEMRRERERACDDAVLNLGHRATDYGEFLLALSRSLRRLDGAWLTGVGMAQSSQLADLHSSEPPSQTLSSPRSTRPGAKSSRPSSKQCSENAAVGPPYPRAHQAAPSPVLNSSRRFSRRIQVVQRRAPVHRLRDTLFPSTNAPRAVRLESTLPSSS